MGTKGLTEKLQEIEKHIEDIKQRIVENEIGRAHV